MNSVDALHRMLSEALGLKPQPGATSRLASEARKICAERGLNADELLRLLSVDPGLFRRLAAVLTVNETFFFRHPQHFEALARRVRIRLEESSGGHVVIWSAGCASGEEPYSIAIAIQRELGHGALSRVKILGSDINGEALATAKTGCYGEWSFRGTTGEFKAKYFRCVAPGKHRLVPEILGAVEWKQATLEQELAALGARSVDAIFFRNVAIYMTDEAVGRLYAGMASALRHGGALTLGLSDPPPSVPELRRLQNGEISTYARRSPRESERRSPAPRPSQGSGKRVYLRGSRAPHADAPAPSAACRAVSPAGEAPAIRALSDAQRLADRGQWRAAVEVLDAEIARAGKSAALLGLRGRIHFASGNLQQSVSDLRSALFIEPAQVVLRFHYALGLQALHRRRDCRAQLLELLREVEGSSKVTNLLHEGITLDSLRRAAVELLRAVE